MTLDTPGTGLDGRRTAFRSASPGSVAPLATGRHRLDLLHGPVNVIPVATRTPTVLTIHDLAFMAYPEQYPRMQVEYLKALTTASARRANIVIRVSQYTADR